MEENGQNFEKMTIDDYIDELAEIEIDGKSTGSAEDFISSSSAVPTSSVTELIRKWAVERNLHTADPTKQALKLGEEMGELFEGLAKGNEDLVKDAIGDMYVVLTILSQQLGITIEECIDLAYEEIKDRKGKMIDGVFVKEADLSDEK